MRDLRRECSLAACAQVLREDASGASAAADGGPAEPSASQDVGGGGLGYAEGAALPERGLADGDAAAGVPGSAVLEECVLQNSRQVRTRHKMSMKSGC